MIGLFIIVVTVSLIFIFVASSVWRCLRQRHYDVPAPDVGKGHRWVMVDVFPRDQTYCVVSEEHIIEGAYCDSCGICVADQYVQIANRTLKCKEPTSAAKWMAHQWIKGNLPADSRCALCYNECGILSYLSDLRCCWCERTIHDQCATSPALETLCDLGINSDVIVPPTCLRLKTVGIKGRRRHVIESVCEPVTIDRSGTWKPLIVMANRKSGNGDADGILQAFRAMLNPVQVIDLSETSPECALAWCSLLPRVTWRVLVAGGDGTVGWVLAAIDNLKLKVSPEVCILPLGTGNDLSRVLGWGQGYSTDVPVRNILESMKRARTVQLDRWQMEITPRKRYGILLPKKRLIVNNYASIGVDALVALNFHRHRQSSPKLFTSRLLNKFWYFTYGTRDVLERECKNLQMKIQVELDGVNVELPSIEGIVVLNISSWGGGCKPWNIRCSSNSQKIPQARYDDGILEVFALYSSFHIAQMQVGLAEPIRLGQASVVKLILKDGNAPMQVDGEPWEQHPATIIINHHNKVNMLLASEPLTP